MRRSLHTDEEIAFLLDEATRGIPIGEICATAHVSLGTFYRWRRRLGGLKPPGVVRLDQVEQENAALRAEVQRLREAMRVQAVRPPAPDRSAPRRGPNLRGADAGLGRFAFVRTVR
jgi:putative transposase